MVSQRETHPILKSQKPIPDWLKTHELFMLRNKLNHLFLNYKITKKQT